VITNTQDNQLIIASIAIIVATVALLVVLKYADEIDGVVTKRVVYDCRLSEISPDFPPDVKNECRKRRAEK
jgi:hypothetical protein